MKSLCCIVLASLPLGAQALYAIDVETQFDGTEMTYDAQDLGNNIAGIILHNRGQQSAKCTAGFNTASESPRDRRAIVEPGKTQALAYRFHTAVVRLRIRLSCEPA